MVFVEQFYFCNGAVDNLDSGAVVVNDLCWWLLMAEVDEGASEWDYFLMIFSAKEEKNIHPFNQTRGCLFQLPRRPLFIIFQRESLFLCNFSLV